MPVQYEIPCANCYRYEWTHKKGHCDPDLYDPVPLAVMDYYDLLKQQAQNKRSLAKKWANQMEPEFAFKRFLEKLNGRKKRRSYFGHPIPQRELQEIYKEWKQGSSVEETFREMEEPHMYFKYISKDRIKLLFKIFAKAKQNLATTE